MDAILGQRCLTLKSPAWHRIGTVVEKAVTPSDAISLVNVDYGVYREPLLLPDGTDSGYVAVVRDAVDQETDRTVLGIGKKYELVHVSEMADQLDELPWPLASVGAIKNGGEVFFSFDLGDQEIAGEGYKMYVGFLHPYTPGASWRTMLTPIRIVCMNTAIAAESAAKSKIAVRHTAGAKARMDHATVVMRTQANLDRLKSQLESMTKVKLTLDAADAILEQVFPYASRGRTAFIVDDEAYAKKADADRRYTDALKSTTLQLYDRICDEFPAIAGTGYALYQAVVEHGDYAAARNPSRAYEDAVFGERGKRKARAFGTILEMATAN